MQTSATYMVIHICNSKINVWKFWNLLVNKTAYKVTIQL